jgi:hypothetical protein
MIQSHRRLLTGREELLLIWDRMSAATQHDLLILVREMALEDGILPVEIPNSFAGRKVG